MFYFKDNKQLTVYFADGNSAVWQVGNPQFDRVLELCQNSNWIQIEMLHNQAKVFLNNKVSIQDDKLIIQASDDATSVDLNTGQDDKLMTVDLGTIDETDPILAFIKLLKDKGTIDTEIERIKPFLQNVFENPFIDAVQEIYEYCKAMDFEITEDGCFLAYKYVNENLTSKYDGKTKHAIGEYTEVTHFDTNRRNECSSGLHFCSKSYLSSYGGQTIIVVKINPKDVVSIPTDYNFAKGRCRRYMMVGYIAQDGTLQTTNLEEATGEKIVKTKAKARLDRKVSKKKADTSKSTGRIQETVQNMKIYKDDVAKVAKVMNISPETVKRNIRKAKAKG